MTDLGPILVELVDLIREIKAGIHIYAPFFRTMGSQPGMFDYVRTRQTGSIFLCTFPGITQRFWDDQRQGWFEKPFSPAFVTLQSSLTEN